MEKIDLSERSKAEEKKLLKEFDVEYLTQITPPDDDFIRRKICNGIYQELKQRVSRNLARFDCYFVFYNETDDYDAVKDYVMFLSTLDQELDNFLNELTDQDLQKGGDQRDADVEDLSVDPVV